MPHPRPTTSSRSPGFGGVQDYAISIVDGGSAVDLTLRTGAVPVGFRPFDVVVSDAEKMSPGFTMFNLIDNTDQLAEPDPANPPRDGYLVVVDGEGEIVWYHRTDHVIGDVRLEADGTIFHEYNDTAARRIDLCGRTLEEWAGLIITGPLKLDSYDRQVVGDDAIVVDTDAMHHEVAPLPDGNIVAISAERRTYEGFPSAGLCDEENGSTDSTN